LVLAALAGTATAAAPTGEPQSWYLLAAADGAVIGHIGHAVSDGPDGRTVTDSQQLSLQESGEPAARVLQETITRQDPSGRPRSIEQVSRNGRSWSRVSATIDAGTAEIVRETPADKRRLRVALPAGVRFDSGIGLLAGWDPTRTPRLEFDNFSLDAQGVEHVTIEPAPDAAPGGALVALRKRYEGRELRGVARLSLDPQHRVVAVTQPMFGTSVTARPVDRATALAPQPPYSVLANAMIKAPYRIEPGALQGHIRYRFGFRDGLAFAPPETGEQRVTLAPGAMTLDICTSCGPGLPSDAATLADARRPTLWLQSDHPQLHAIADPVARLQVSDTRKMEMLADRARLRMTGIDFSGHFSALETLQRGSGDCTEAAVLLAALGRAAGIPTRVANGLVYSRARYHGVSNVFMPHSWTLAWVDGKWRSFDMALFAFDATHIALTVGDGDARSVAAASQLASLLRWDAMAEVRTRAN